jgi:hypothetical protein
MRRLVPFAEAGLLVDGGTMPRVAPLGMIGLGLRRGVFEIAARVAAGAAQEQPVGSGAALQLRPAMAMLAPCWIPISIGTSRFGSCAQAEVDWMHAEATGLAQARTVDSWGFSLGAALAAELVLVDHVEVGVRAGALIPVVHPSFEVAGVGSVFASGIAARGEASVAFGF